MTAPRNPRGLRKRKPQPPSGPSGVSGPSTYACGCAIGGTPRCVYAVGPIPERGVVTVHGTPRPTVQDIPGTVTTYRCRDCGETWTWRNTPDGARGLAETQALHGGQLYRVEDGGPDA
ncbi:hypothetical protein SEA_DOGGS_60 [Gordonia phage Doggs]|nr:hypothetical protein SEA_DOGGS_60 [Gordonia phage Doggs]